MKIKNEPPAAPYVSGKPESPAYIVYHVSNGRLFPLLDFSAEPEGSRYPLKTFSTNDEAAIYCGAEGLTLVTIVPIN